jgi:hypothetical protein
MRVNADTGSNYATNGVGATAATLGTIPGASTNTDRIAQIALDIACGSAGSWTVGYAVTSGAATSTATGVAAATVTVGYLVDAAPTSLRIYTSSTSNFQAGARLIVEGLA